LPRFRLDFNLKDLHAMKTESHTQELIPPALLEQVEARAAAEHRPARDMVREAVEHYLHTHRKPTVSAPPTEAQRRAAWEAGERILARRKLHPMPEGETIKSLISFGRA
jgi:hypothetical protein